MKFVILCVILLSTTYALPGTKNEVHPKRLYVDPIADEPIKDVTGRIINGHEVVPHSIPYQVYLVVLSGIGGWSCGGSLISPRHVLTAAHCLKDGAAAIAYLGVHNFRQLEDSRVAGFSEALIIHNDYNDTSYSNDIGVILLEEEVELNENISTVPLPSRDVHSDFEGENVRISDWGLISEGGNPSEVLLEANTTVISNDQCRGVFDIVIDSQICTLGDLGERTCDGDSGGPLVASNTQIGIVSYGARGCPEGYPSGFTRITSYLEWLEENTGLTF